MLAGPEKGYSGSRWGGRGIIALTAQLVTDLAENLFNKRIIFGRRKFCIRIESWTGGSDVQHLLRDVYGRRRRRSGGL